jgi:hypothetical protein
MASSTKFRKKSLNYFIIWEGQAQRAHSQLVTSVQIRLLTSAVPCALQTLSRGVEVVILRIELAAYCTKP